MRTFRTGFLVASLALAAACGGSKDAGPAGGQQAAPSQGQGAAPGSLQDFAKGMSQLAQQMQGGPKAPDGKAYEPVDFKSLVALLPEVPGWERGTPSGESMTTPFAHSMAKAEYSKGDASVSVEILDSAFNQLAIAPVQFVLSMKIAQESADGFEKSQSFGGQPGYAKWEKSARTGEILVIVASRYIVTIRGQEIGDPSAMDAVVGKVDFGKLASMK